MFLKPHSLWGTRVGLIEPSLDSDFYRSYQITHFILKTAVGSENAVQVVVRTFVTHLPFFYSSTRCNEPLFFLPVDLLIYR